MRRVARLIRAVRWPIVRLNRKLAHRQRRREMAFTLGELIARDPRRGGAFLIALDRFAGAFAGAAGATKRPAELIRGPTIIASSVSDVLFISAEARALWMFASFIIEQSLSDAPEAIRLELATDLAGQYRKRETLIFADCATQASPLGALVRSLPPGVGAQMWHRASDLATARLYGCLAPAGSANPYAEKFRQEQQLSQPQHQPPPATDTSDAPGP